MVADINEIANAFDEQQDYDIRLLALTTGGIAWKPPGATDPSIADAAAQSARRLQIFIRPVEIDGNPLAGLQKAQDERQVILLVVDSACLPDTIHKQVDRLDLPNLAVLVVNSNGSAVSAEAWIAGLPVDGAFSQAKAAGLVKAATPGALANELELLIDEARRRIRSCKSGARAVDAELALLAEEQGIDIGCQPHLSGPGAGIKP